MLVSMNRVTDSEIGDLFHFRYKNTEWQIFTCDLPCRLIRENYVSSIDKCNHAIYLIVIITKHDGNL